MKQDRKFQIYIHFLNMQTEVLDSINIACVLSKLYVQMGCYIFKTNSKYME